MKKNKFLAVILAMAVAVGAAGVTTYAVGKDANDTAAPSAVATAASASDTCLLYTSPSPRDGLLARMTSSA